MSFNLSLVLKVTQTDKIYTNWHTLSQPAVLPICVHRFSAAAFCLGCRRVRMTPAWSSRAWRLSGSCCEYLARIEDALRIERLLELPHDLDGSRPVLAQQGVALAQADPMFKIGRASCRERVCKYV